MGGCVRLVCYLKLPCSALQNSAVNCTCNGFFRSALHFPPCLLSLSLSVSVSLPRLGLAFFLSVCVPVTLFNSLCSTYCLSIPSPLRSLSLSGAQAKFVSKRIKAGDSAQQIVAEQQQQQQQQDFGMGLQTLAEGSELDEALGLGLTMRPGTAG